jgi:hypothetical protein
MLNREMAPIACLVIAVALGKQAWADDLSQQATKLIEQHCLRCHNEQDFAGELSLAFRPKDWHAESLLEMINPVDGKAEMPKGASPLSRQELEVLNQWVHEGAAWPEGVKLKPPRNLNLDWWSLKPLPTPEVSARTLHDAQQRTLKQAWIKSDNPIDWLVADRLKADGLSFAPLANRRTLIRRLYYDLIGLPPTRTEIAVFESNTEPTAYERLVDRLLDSPRYGERWARHWLDVAHYADTHGYDKDKPRPNAWPYRDYVIRSFNEDKPWSRFVLEQVAGDELFPESADGTEALGFLSAGPWDFVGHAEVPESKIDGKIARHLDRDDMVRTVVQSFMSLTVGCAQCHDHKFDPISQVEYYQLQSVFAALDRADKAYFDDPTVTRKYAQFVAEQKKLERQIAATEAAITMLGGERLKELDDRTQANSTLTNLNDRDEFGYHSSIEAKSDVEKWIQLDLGRPVIIHRIVVRPAFDTFNKIGADFGMPKEFVIALSNNLNSLKAIVKDVGEAVESSSSDVNSLRLNYISNDQRTPGQLVELLLDKPTSAQYLRFSTSQLAQRLPNDFCLALAELEVYDNQNQNVARHAKVTALDSIEAPTRWQRTNLVDGFFPRLSGVTSQSMEQAKVERNELRKNLLGEPGWHEFEEVTADLDQIQVSLKALPNPKLVYAGTVHTGSGAFQGTGASGGKPREVHLLHRGEVTSPRDLVAPSALSIGGLSAEFELNAEHTEGQRRVALAEWISSPANSFTWRSVVNRVWQYHFGTGLVDTPSDFGQMGGRPTHQQLLDWLAIDFRDNGQSLKQLHRRIVTSHTYRQSADGPTNELELKRLNRLDAENRLLWRANRRKLDAEAVRDSILKISGKLDLKMGGPGFEEFVLEKPEHSPHYRYDLLDFENASTHRRSIYRFTVRSQLQPFLNSLDCADPSIQVATRNQGQTPLQALAMLNNGLVLTHSRHFAAKLKQQMVGNTGQADAGNEPSSSKMGDAIQHSFEEVTGRLPTAAEKDKLVSFTEQHGLENFCRLLFNLNEFLFVE